MLRERFPDCSKHLMMARCFLTLPSMSAFPTRLQVRSVAQEFATARLTAAVLHAASAGESNHLVRLLVELSTIAASEQKGADYILDNPDLVVHAQDSDALRRLFETRTRWPGARHARLTIANVLSDDLDSASRHFRHAVNWTRHHNEIVNDKKFDRARPEHIDRAAIPLFHVVKGHPKRAIAFMRIVVSLVLL